MKFLFRQLLLPAVLFVRSIAVAEPPPGFQSEIYAVGLDQPTAIEFLPDGRLLVAELQEKILVIQPDAGVPDAAPFLHLDKTGIFGGQGLLGIAADPDFDANGYYYVFYTQGALNRNRVSRFTASGNGTVAGSEFVIWQSNEPALDEHQGGGIAIGADGRIYISVGEAFVPDDAQRLTSYRGKILRVNKNGSIPIDNPFYDGTGPNLDAIWAYGLRNPFRISVDSLTGRLFIGDVGGNDPSVAKEEINLGVPGANYGWPECEGPCGIAGFTSPIFSYAHAARDASVIGGFTYRGSQFPNAYFGSYFFADYAQNWIRRLTFNTNGNISAVVNFEPADGTLDGDYGDPTGLTQGPDGALYYADFSHDPNNYWAMIRRIRYVGSTNQPPSSIASASVTAGQPPLVVSFSSAGSTDPEGRSITFGWTFGDGTTSTNTNPKHTYSQARSYSVRLTVSDGANSTMSAPLTIVVGNPPSVIIDTPIAGRTFRAGDVITFSGHANDSEDGSLPANALNWALVFHHAEHIHPVLGSWSATNRGSLVIPTNGHPFGHNTSYELTLIATDSSGLQGSGSVVVKPELVDVTVDSTPGGLPVKFDGISRITPFTDGSVIGFQHSIEAPDQLVGGSNYIFQAWTDGGAQSHTLVVPGQNVNLSAVYRPGQRGDLVIESAVIQSNGFRLRFSSVAGRNYTVERSQNMLSGSWSKVADQVPGTGSSVEIIDAITNLNRLGFYRVSTDADGSSGPPAFATGAEAHGLNVATLSTPILSSGDNRVLLVGLCWYDPSGNSVSAVTFGGVTCAPVFTTNWFYGGGRLVLYSLTAPPGGTQTLQVTMSNAASELAVVGLIFTNANQFVSLGAVSGNFAELAASMTTISVPSVANDLAVDLLGYSAFNAAPETGQSLRMTSSNPGYASLQASTKPGSNTTTVMSWSMSESTEISQIGITVKSR